jgi:hypothetical protein
LRAGRFRPKRLPQQIGEWCRQFMCRHGAEVLAVIGHQSSVRRAAEGVRLFQYRVEHRGKLSGRGINDLQHLGGCGLLLQGLARFGQEPRVLHRDDRLCREVLQQRDLLVGEGTHLLPKDVKRADQFTFLEHRHGKAGMNAPQDRVNREHLGIRWLCRNVLHPHGFLSSLKAAEHGLRRRMPEPR